MHIMHVKNNLLNCILALKMPLARLNYILYSHPKPRFHISQYFFFQNLLLTTTKCFENLET